MCVCVCVCVCVYVCMHVCVCVTVCDCVVEYSCLLHAYIISMYLCGNLALHELPNTCIDA